ncbi:hypothetical protein [Paraburkholderia sp. ZP32-5]|uniref:hypothetical protein n=1 Tax=Paraburkholderia sp. ZP32-5 TaxID=2883245 RepID=UPI001F2D69E4|nr:hypothetical protein [Paraburkholderia sp. ZP32-5]
MHSKTAPSSFTRELEDFVVRLKNFSDVASEARASEKATRHAAPSKPGMLTMRSSRYLPVPPRGGVVAGCPRSIQRLCAVQAPSNGLPAKTASARRARVVWDAARAHNAPERVLVRRKCDSQIFEATMPTQLNPTLSDAPSQLEGSFPFASISRANAPFSVLTGHATVSAWGERLRALTHAEVVDAIDGWLTFALGQIVGPANGERAAYIGSLIRLRYQWDQIHVRLNQQGKSGALFSIHQ